jgi:hypothetical protein
MVLVLMVMVLTVMALMVTVLMVMVLVVMEVTCGFCCLSRRSRCCRCSRSWT